MKHWKRKGKRWKRVVDEIRKEGLKAHNQQRTQWIGRIELGKKQTKISGNTRPMATMVMMINDA